MASGRSITPSQPIISRRLSGPAARSPAARLRYNAPTRPAKRFSATSASSCCRSAEELCMRGLRKFTTALLLTTAVAAAYAADQEQIPGVGPVGPLKQLKGGLAFAEGPAADATGNLYFTNIPAEEIWKV